MGEFWQELAETAVFVVGIRARIMQLRAFASMNVGFGADLACFLIVEASNEREQEQ
jgi:hypothetical protein